MTPIRSLLPLLGFALGCASEVTSSSDDLNLTERKIRGFTVYAKTFAAGDPVDREFCSPPLLARRKPEVAFQFARAGSGFRAFRDVTRIEDIDRTAGYFATGVELPDFVETADRPLRVKDIPGLEASGIEATERYALRYEGYSANDEAKQISARDRDLRSAGALFIDATPIQVYFPYDTSPNYGIGEGVLNYGPRAGLFGLSYSERTVSYSRSTQPARFEIIVLKCDKPFAEEDAIHIELKINDPEGPWKPLRSFEFETTPTMHSYHEPDPHYRI